MRKAAVIAASVVAAALVSQLVSAQHQHPSGHQHHGAAPPGARPSMSARNAFAASTEVARILDADPQTDWSTVDLERLRQHLIDMSEVVLRAEVKQTPVPGGVAMDVTGAGRTERAIVAMVIPHAAEL